MCTFLLLLSLSLIDMNVEEGFICTHCVYVHTFKLIYINIYTYHINRYERKLNWQGEIERERVRRRKRRL